MTTSGRDHPIIVEPNPRRVTVTFNGRTVADTTQALELREKGHAPVQYIPRGDVAMDLLTPTDHATHCPYKGDASYFSLDVDGRAGENAVWTYESPNAAVADIKGYLAFYPRKVDKIEID